MNPAMLDKSEPYLKFKFLYPPRPENCITTDRMVGYEKTHFGQPKLNGSCCLIFTDGKTYFHYERKGEANRPKDFCLTDKELEILNKHDGNNWNVFVGEYMNKSKAYKDGKPWTKAGNHKIVLFDILVYKGKYLLGSTFQQRVELMDELFGKEEYDEWLYKITDKIYRVKTFYGNFLALWNEIVKIDMLEGLVMKRMDAKLERGGTLLNNVGSQVKVRKPSNSYPF